MDAAQPAAEVPCGWSVAFLILFIEALEAVAKWREDFAYAAGFADGRNAGEAEAETDMAQHWAALSKSVRADADRLKRPVREPVARSNDSPDDSIWFTPDEWERLTGHRNDPATGSAIIHL